MEAVEWFGVQWAWDPSSRRADDPNHLEPRGPIREEAMKRCVCDLERSVGNIGQ